MTFFTAAAVARPWLIEVGGIGVASVINRRGLARASSLFVWQVSNLPSRHWYSINWNGHHHIAVVLYFFVITTLLCYVSLSSSLITKYDVFIITITIFAIFWRPDKWILYFYYYPNHCPSLSPLQSLTGSRYQDPPQTIYSENFSQVGFSSIKIFILQNHWRTYKQQGDPQLVSSLATLHCV